MFPFDPVILSLAVALGIGLLIGTEPERRKGESPAPSAAGFADTHSAAISIAALVGAGKMAAPDPALPSLIALSTNTVTKLAASLFGGGLAFALRVIPGLFLVILAAWAGWRLG